MACSGGAAASAQLQLELSAETRDGILYKDHEKRKWPKCWFQVTASSTGSGTAGAGGSALGAAEIVGTGMMQLTVRLRYEDGGEIKDPGDLLKLRVDRDESEVSVEKLAGSIWIITFPAGRVPLKFFVEFKVGEVSQKHRGKKFVLAACLGAETNARLVAVSNAVLVKSKPPGPKQLKRSAVKRSRDEGRSPVAKRYRAEALSEGGSETPAEVDLPGTQSMVFKPSPTSEVSESSAASPFSVGDVASFKEGASETPAEVDPRFQSKVFKPSPASEVSESSAASPFSGGDVAPFKEGGSETPAEFDFLDTQPKVSKPSPAYEVSESSAASPLSGGDFAPFNADSAASGADLTKFYELKQVLQSQCLGGAWE